MKKLLVIFSFFVISHTVFGQEIKQATMTREFTDSLKIQIAKIIPAHYTIKLLYKSTMSEDGKIPKPLIWRETADGTIEDNDFVQKLRVLIKAAPAWNPAIDVSSNKSISSEVLFGVDINNGKIKISSNPQNKD